jgi:hypothetical protein
MSEGLSKEEIEAINKQSRFAPPDKRNGVSMFVVQI